MHVGEPVEPPPVSPARGPPIEWHELVQGHDDRDIMQAVPDERQPLALTCRTDGTVRRTAPIAKIGVQTADFRGTRGHSPRRQQLVEVPLTVLSLELSPERGLLTRHRRDKEAPHDFPVTPNRNIISPAGMSVVEIL